MPCRRIRSACRGHYRSFAGQQSVPSTISELNKKAYVRIVEWRNHPLQGGRYPYIYVDGICLRRNWGGEFENVAILMAIAVNEDGYREALGVAESLSDGIEKTLTYCDFSSEHWTRIRTNNVYATLSTGPLFYLI